MNKEAIDNIFKISDVLASRKRVVIMFVLDASDNYLGYNNISKTMHKMGIPIGSSEMYKNIHMLEKHGYIAKNERLYIITKKGKAAVECIKKIILTEPSIPNIKAVWE